MIPAEQCFDARQSISMSGYLRRDHAGGDWIALVTFASSVLRLTPGMMLLFSFVVPGAAAENSSLASQKATATNTTRLAIGGMIIIAAGLRQSMQKKICSFTSLAFANQRAIADS